MGEVDKNKISLITLDESKLLFKDCNEFRSFLATRLGFVSDEINRILCLVKWDLNNTILIDTLYEVYAILDGMENHSSSDKILCSKLLRVLNYHLAHNREDNESGFIKAVYAGIEQVNDLLASSYALSKKTSGNDGIKR